MASALMSCGARSGLPAELSIFDGDGNEEGSKVVTGRGTRESTS
jgi:hypothetical protein